MSYILDALKKSEEERHQGQLPNLGSNSALIHNPKSKSSLWPWVIAVLLLLNVAFVGFWVLKEPSKKSSTTENSISVGENSNVATQNDAPLAVTPAPQEKPNKVEVQADVTQTDLPPAPGKQEEASQAYDVQATPQKPREHNFSLSSKPIAGHSYQAKPVDTKPRETSRQFEQPELIVPGGGYQASAKTENSANETSDEAPLLITPKGKSRPYTGPAYTANVAQQPNSTENYRVESPNEEDQKTTPSERDNMASIPSLTDKPHEFQIQIPDMAFNSHIYTNKPSSRRVMINNIYLREGQTFYGMKVEQITEEGIVLSLKNERFKMGVLRDWYSPR